MFFLQKLSEYPYKFWEGLKRKAFFSIFLSSSWLYKPVTYIKSRKGKVQVKWNNCRSDPNGSAVQIIMVNA